jgi:hypothetical protein
VLGRGVKVMVGEAANMFISSMLYRNRFESTVRFDEVEWMASSAGRAI